MDLVAEVESKIPFARWTVDDLSQLGPAYRQAQDFESALIIYERLVELAPENAEFHFVCGVLYLYFTRYEQALHSLQEAVRLEPERAGVVRKYIDSTQTRRAVP